MSVTLEIKELISIILLLVLAYLVFRLFEQRWSYKISKPFKWEHASKQGKVSQRLKKMESTYRDKVRFYTVWLEIERLKERGIEGSFAELGVYQGETARFIHEMDTSRDLHLFDTFEGFDENDLKFETSNDPKYSQENFSDTELEKVKSTIGTSDRLHFHRGFFPNTTSEKTDIKYAFVHLDADLYAPTLSGLKYFYPRLSEGGVLLIHDYNHTWPGVKKAVDEFVRTITETPTEIADWQGSVMILKAK